MEPGSCSPIRSGRRFVAVGSCAVACSASRNSGTLHSRAEQQSSSNQASKKQTFRSLLRSVLPAAPGNGPAGLRLGPDTAGNRKTKNPSVGEERDCSVCCCGQSPERFALCIFCGVKAGQHYWNFVGGRALRNALMGDGATFSGEPPQFHPEKPSALLWCFHLVLFQDMNLRAAPKVSRGNVRSNRFSITVFGFQD